MATKDKTIKLMTIVGARPQFIKAAALSKVITESAKFSEFILHTGQHYDEKLSNIFFNELSIPRPDLILDIKEQRHGAMTGRQLIEIEAACIAHKPDIMVVYGDVNSTLSAALAAAKLHIPIAHIEAGLRSYQRQMPEEINRVLVDHLSTWLFAPTTTAKENLIREGIDADKISVVGDIMYDAYLQFKPMIKAIPSPIAHITELNERPFIVATIHRAENTDDPNKLKALFDSLSQLSKMYPIILPCHPRTKKQIALLDIQFPEQFHFIEPVSYLQMQKLLMQACCVLTDSGGLQKEAFFNQKPCVVLRNKTEWLELLETGWTVLPRSLTPDDIIDAVRQVLNKNHNNAIMPYGKGDAAEQIMSILSKMPTGL